MNSEKKLKLMISSLRDKELVKFFESYINCFSSPFNKVLSNEAGELIAERVEGNLLAAAQEVEKLCLVVDSEEIAIDDVLQAVTDSARYDVFQWVDAVVACDLGRAIRIVRGLRDAGMEPILVQWALGRELRQLTSMAHALAAGERLEQVMQAYRVWSNRNAVVSRILKRHSEARFIHMLRHAMAIDTMVKGAAEGALGALAREESRGVHYRSDHPESADAWRAHLNLRPLEADGEIYMKSKGGDFTIVGGPKVKINP